MHKVVWTRSALRDIEEIHSYIAKESPLAARGIVVTIREMTQRLSFHPFMGKPGRKEGTRELVVPQTSFVIVYCVKEQQLEILRALHSSRRYF